MAANRKHRLLDPEPEQEWPSEAVPSHLLHLLMVLRQCHWQGPTDPDTGTVLNENVTCNSWTLLVHVHLSAGRTCICSLTSPRIMQFPKFKVPFETQDNILVVSQLK